MFGLLSTLLSRLPSRTTLDSSTPFIVITRVRINVDKVDEYVDLAKKTGESIQLTEPGILHHTFGALEDSSGCFVWSEVYRNDQAFVDHLANAVVGEFLSLQEELSEDFVVEVYGNVGEVCKQQMLETKLPMKFYTSVYDCGYTRIV